MPNTALDPASQARQVGIETRAVPPGGGGFNFLRQKIYVIAQGATNSVYALTKRQVYSEFEAGTRYGFGSPIHLACRQLLPASGDGAKVPVIIDPLEDASSGVAAKFTISAAGTQSTAGTYQIRVNNILSTAFTLAVNATAANAITAIVAAVNAVVNLPVTASAQSASMAALLVKWKGASGNTVKVSVDGTEAGITFTISQSVSGATNPSVSTALTAIGNDWATLVLNALEIEDTTTLDLYKAWGLGRWDSLVHKPAVVFTGCTETTVVDAIAVSDARKTDYINAQLVSPGSDDLPLVVAARQLARIAKMAQENPPTDYGWIEASGLTPGDDADQWDFTARDAALKGGSSSVQVQDGVVYLSDTVTFYHPTGDQSPAYQYVVDIVKLQNLINGLSLIFDSPTWGSGPLIPDAQPTRNPRARKPCMAKTEVGKMLDIAELDAVVVDAATSKVTMTANIVSSKRLDLTVPVTLSGNTNQTAVVLEFSALSGAV